MWCVPFLTVIHPWPRTVVIVNDTNALTFVVDIKDATASLPMVRSRCFLLALSFISSTVG